MSSNRPKDYDAVIVGASLAGCTAATLLGRAGARVALVEKQPDPKAFKRMCSHFFQASSVPTLERLGWLEPVEEAGGIRTRVQAWTRWGWIKPPPPGSVCVNLRREVLDPLIRERTAQEPGVELMLGRAATRVLREGGEVTGVVVRGSAGEERELRAPLTVGADGRDSKVAELAGLPDKKRPHGRFAYGGYFEGPATEIAPDAAFWMLDPQWAAAFPTDFDLTFYAVMGTMDLLPEFKADPEAALVRFVSELPEAPPIAESRLVSPARSGGAGAGDDRRRRPRGRPAVRNRLRLGTAVGRMAGRRGRSRAARRGAPGEGSQSLQAAALARPRRPRLPDQRLRDRAPDERDRAADLLRRRPRPEVREHLRAVRDPRNRPRAGIPPAAAAGNRDERRSAPGSPRPGTSSAVFTKRL
jgi:hypothetical protein